MKTKSVILVALMAVSVSVLASAEPVNSKVTVLNQKAGIFKVIYQGSGLVTMTVADVSGNVLFREDIKTETGFIRPVNFSAMQPGVYKISIADENGEQIQTVTYTNEPTVKNVHIAKVGDQGKYLLAIGNSEAQDITVRIFDGSDKLVYSENRSVTANFGIVYNLQQISGTPTFEVTDKTGNDLVIK